MKKSLIFAGAFLLFSLVACESSSGDRAVIVGRGLDFQTQTIIDTTSQIRLDEPVFLQCKYGGKFDFAKLKISFYKGTLANKGKELWSHEVAVSNKADSYTLQAKAKHGGYISARELMHIKTPGPIVVEFSGEGKVIASKEISLVE